MLKKLKSLFSRKKAVTSVMEPALASILIESTLVSADTPTHVSIGAVDAFAFSQSLRRENGLPYANWSKVNRWLAKFPDKKLKVQAWSACEPSS